LKDLGFMAEFGQELGEIAGRSAGRWFNSDFMRRSTFDKGKTVGEVAGALLMEAVLLFLGPEEWIARGAALAGEAGRASSRLGKAAVKLLEKSSTLRPLLRLRQARLGAGVGGAVAAVRETEEVVTAARRVIGGPDDLIRHFGGRLRTEGGALEE